MQPSLPVSLEQALYLIRSTLLSLNDANRTGNYTVLRDLAAPDFQARNAAADLGLNFSTCGAAISISTVRGCWRRNSSTRPHSINGDCCALQVTFRPSRSRSSSISPSRL
ncbi:hypothetical protein ACQ5SK_19580 [Bradyrhizobium japonicum]